MPSARSVVVLLLVSIADGFDVVSRPFIQLSTHDKLPTMFTNNWPTWVLERDSLTKIPDTDGFVNPISIDELWQPLDLKIPDAQLAVGLHVRDGVIRHILPALDLSMNGGCHRNRGLCSVPRAHMWMDFHPASWQHCQLVASLRKHGDDEWETVCSTPIRAIEDAVQQIVQVSDAVLGDGSHIIHIPLETPFEGVKTGTEIRIQIIEENEALASLQVSVSQTEAGSESMYLPDAYKPLFEDESLRRPAYMEMLKRRKNV
jgi:hypothetical protein